MNLRHIFSVVIGVHLAVIALLFVTPGCQSSGGEPDEGTASRGGFTAADTTPEHARHAQNWQTGPVHTPQSVNKGGQLYSPSRPTWNVNDNNSAAVSVVGNDESVEVLQPVRSGGNALDSTGFGELVPVTSDSGLGSGSVSAAGGGTSYRVQTGDNLTRIAAQHGVSVSALMAANGLDRQSANKIRVGQELTIPSGSAAAQSGQAASGAAASGEAYTVRSGDTLGGIASRHGTTVAALRSANNISGDRILVGQKLRLPSGSSATTQQSGASPSAATHTAAPAGEGGSYTVRSGETLGGIAARHGTTVQALMGANGIDDPRSLRAGQTLKIPGSSSASQTQSSSQTPAARSTTTTPSSSQTTLPATGSQMGNSFRAEPAPILPAPGGFGTGSSFGTGSAQGSGDDLLSDPDSIPTVSAE